MEVARKIVLSFEILYFYAPRRRRSDKFVSEMQMVKGLRSEELIDSTFKDLHSKKQEEANRRVM